MNVDNLVDELYGEMLKRCGIMEEEEETEEEETGQETYIGDLNVFDDKPEAYGKGIGFERIRRITGYITGTVDRWNNGKKAELKDRKKHEFLSSTTRQFE